MYFFAEVTYLIFNKRNKIVIKYTSILQKIEVFILIYLHKKTIFVENIRRI